MEKPSGRGERGRRGTRMPSTTCIPLPATAITRFRMTNTVTCTKTILAFTQKGLLLQTSL